MKKLVPLLMATTFSVTLPFAADSLAAKGESGMKGQMQGHMGGQMESHMGGQMQGPGMMEGSKDMSMNTQRDRMRQHMEEMQQIMNKAGGTRDPEQRRQLLQKHMDQMHQGMGMMQGMMGGNANQGGQKMTDEERMQWMQQRMEMMQMMMEQMQQHQKMMGQ